MDTKDQTKINTNCQYYSTENPVEGELVLVQFTERNDSFIKAILLEYEYTGMMNYKDVTKKRRVSSWNRFIPLDKNMVARVDDVDTDKKIVQLSLAFLDEGVKDEKNASQLQEKLMIPFNENKLMENFIKSLCVVNKLDYTMIWTSLVHCIDKHRREYNDDMDENISIWKYFSDNIDTLDSWIEESKLDDTIGTEIKKLFQKKTESVIHKIVSRIGIISLGGVESTKQLLSQVLSNIKFKYTFKYDSTPYYIFESSSEDSTVDEHIELVKQLEKESSKFNPKVFIKTDMIGKVLA